MQAKTVKKALRIGLIILLAAAIALIGLHIFTAAGAAKAFNNDGVPVSDPAPLGEELLEDARWDSQRYALRFDAAASRLEILSRETGEALFQSYPAIREEDNVNFIAANSLRAPVVIEYAAADSGRNTMSYVNNKPLEEYFPLGYYRIDGGLAVTVDAAECSIRFQMECIFDNDRLIVRIPENSVEEYGDSRLISVTCLPFFGAARQGDKGYTVLPDGVGALVEYDKPHTLYNGNGYAKMIYGEDPTMWTETIYDTKLHLPFYAIVNEGKILAATVTKGDTNAWLNVSPPSYRNQAFYSSYVTLTYRGYYPADMQVDGQASVINESGRIAGDRELQYDFAVGGDLDYTDAAAMYAARLEEGGTAPKAALGKGPFLRLFMGVRKNSSGLGGDYLAMTTAEQACVIADELGGGYVYELAGWYKNGYADSLPDRFPPARAIGGEKGLQMALAHIRELGGVALLEDDCVESRPGYLGINGKGVMQPGQSLYTVQITGPNGNAWDGGRFFSASQALLNLQKNLDRLAAYGPSGLSQAKIGAVLYSDYSDNDPRRRGQTLNVYRQMLEEMRAIGPVYAGGASGYVLGRVQGIKDIPLSGGNGFMIDRSVPVYPLAVGKYADCYSAVINRESEPETALLKALEYGLTPAYELTWLPSDELASTPYSGLFSSEYRQWKERVEQAAAVCTRLGNGVLIGHRRTGEGVYEAAYENGAVVTVDYNRLTYTVS